tara:strand:- start:291 stop:419 length:129 start_codon:yes stop_codon:yes gene_type:complete
MKLKIREEKIKLVNEQKTVLVLKEILLLTIKKDVVENRYIVR